MGGWKESGLGSRHGPDGIRKYTKRQSILVTPGYAPPREPHYVPLHRRGHRRGRRGDGGLAASELFDDAQRATLTVALRHLHPVAGATGGDGAGDRPGSGRAPRATSASRRRSRSRCCRRGCRRTSSRAARPARRARGRRDGRAAPAGGPRGDRPRLHRLDPRRSSASDAAQHRPDPALRAARPRHRDQPELAGDGLPGTAGAAGRPTDERPTSRSSRRRGADARRRRRDRRLRRRRRRDRRRAERGRQAGLRRSRWAATTTSPSSTGSSSGPTRASSSTGPVPDRGGPGQHPGRLCARRRHRAQLDQLPAH